MKAHFGRHAGHFDEFFDMRRARTRLTTRRRDQDGIEFGGKIVLADFFEIGAVLGECNFQRMEALRTVVLHGGETWIFRIAIHAQGDHPEVLPDPLFDALVELGECTVKIDRLVEIHVRPLLFAFSECRRSVRQSWRAGSATRLYIAQTGLYWRWAVDARLIARITDPGGGSRHLLWRSHLAG